MSEPRETARQIDVAQSQLEAARLLLRNGDHADALEELDKAVESVASLTADLAQARQDKQRVELDLYGKLQSLLQKLYAAEQARDEALGIVAGLRDVIAGRVTSLEDIDAKVGRVRGSAPDNEEGVSGEVAVFNAPHEPSQCCQSAARTALLEAAEDMRIEADKDDELEAGCAWHAAADWLTTRAGGPRT